MMVLFFVAERVAIVVVFLALLLIKVVYFALRLLRLFSRNKFSLYNLIVGLVLPLNTVGTAVLMQVWVEFGYSRKIGELYLLYRLGLSRHQRLLLVLVGVVDWKDKLDEHTGVYSKCGRVYLASATLWAMKICFIPAAIYLRIAAGNILCTIASLKNIYWSNPRISR